MMRCKLCGGHIFLADDDPEYIWAHLEDTNCDDPTPMIGPPSIEPEDFPRFTPLFNMNGLEAAHEDKAVEETYLRLIIESPYFRRMAGDDQELFMIGLAQEILSWLAKSDGKLG